MRRWFAILVLVLLSGVGLASSLVVYPFDSQDALLGVAVADKVAAAFEGGSDVIDPGTAPGLLPPMVAEGGFINLATLVGPPSLTGPSGAQLMQAATGADVAATGRIAVTDQGLVLSLEVASRSGLRRVTLTASQDTPGDLAAAAVPVIAGALGVPTPSVDTSLDLSGPYGDYVRALTLVGAGLPQDAASVLASAAEQGDLAPRAAALQHDLDALLQGATGGNAARLAVMSLSLPNLDEARSLDYFTRVGQETGLPVAEVWIGALDSSLNDKQGASEAFDRAADAYPFGRAARAAFLVSHGDDGGTADIDAVVAAAKEDRGDAAALLGAAVAANEIQDVDREKAALTALGHAAPFLPYSFERLSFLAFDEDRPLAAAEALAVAVQLEPQSDLYWTNLGWADYLLGFLDRSEQASNKALELSPTQFIASYNLGLVKVVTGRLEQGLDDYANALRYDAGVDDEAIHDLENARKLYPDQAGVEFALARLYEADGRRTDARDAYRRYVRAAGAGAPLVGAALERVRALSAPPPPIEIADGIALRLGRRGADATPYHPGDPLYPSFELTTPGDALPRQMHVAYTLADTSGTTLATAEEDVSIPENAVGYVIDDLELQLPADLAPGTYTLTVRASAGEDQEVTGQADVAIDGAPQALRQLLGRGISMKTLDAGTVLYGPEDLAQPEVLTDRLLAELGATAGEAEQALPTVTGGRFDGLTGAQVFQRTTATDVDDFLRYLLASGAHDTSFTFVDAYAQWVLDGTPEAPPANAP